MSELAVSTPKVQANRGAADSTEAADEFVRAFNEMRNDLASTLFYVLGNQDDAQDAVQETFIKCWRTRQALDDVKNLRAWVFRVGLNAAKDMTRNAWRRRAKHLGDAPPPDRQGDPSPMDILEDRESMERLRSALMTLRPEEKEVFFLRQNGNLTYEEIADQRRLPVGTVKTQMRSALQKLKRILQET